MMKEYIITIADSHFSDGEKENSEFNTVGTFALTEKGYRVSYKETDPSMAGAVTTIEYFDGNRVEMTRKGPFATQMIMELNRRRTCLYNTPYGEFALGVFTKCITSQMDVNGGTLQFAYSLDCNTGLISENELTVTVKEAQ